MVIAEKSSSAIVVYIIVAVLLAVAATLLIILIALGELTVYNVVELILLSLCIIYSIVQIVRVAKTPRTIITYENGVLKFADGLQCSPRELERVNYRRAVTRRAIFYTWGILIITVKGQTHKYRYVANVEEVHDRLIDLNRREIC